MNRSNVALNSYPNSLLERLTAAQFYRATCQTDEKDGIALNSKGKKPTSWKWAWKTEKVIIQDFESMK